MRIDQEGFPRLLEDGDDLLARHTRKVREEVLERITRFEVVVQR